MLRKQKGKILLFLYIVTLRLATLRPCLGSVDIKTLDTADDLQANSQSNELLDEGDKVYSKRDGKWLHRFGRLIFGRRTQKLKDAVNVNTARDDGLLKNLDGYRNYDEGTGKSKWSIPDPVNASRKSSQQIPVSRILSHTMEHMEPKPETRWEVSQGGTPEPKEYGNMRSWISEPSDGSLGCISGEIDSNPDRVTDDIKPVVSKNNAGYQSDSAPLEEGRPARGEIFGLHFGPGTSVNEDWLRTGPLVQCGSNNMSLTVRRSDATQLLLYQGRDPPLPVVRLSEICGYSVNTTWSDLVFTARYDSCHVRQEDGNHVLFLLFRGTPMNMSCPVSPTSTAKPLSLCCNPFGMTITVRGTGSTNEIGVEVGRDWKPLALLVGQCGYIVQTFPGKVVIAVPFSGCGVTFEDGKHTLTISSRGKDYTISCPVLPSAPLQTSPPFPPKHHDHFVPPLITLAPSPSTTPSPPPPPPPLPPPGIPEHYPKAPMFHWNQPHYPDRITPAHIPHMSHSPSFPSFYQRVPVLYPQRPPKPSAQPEVPPAPKSSADFQIPTPVFHTLKVPANPHDMMSVPHIRQPPDPAPGPVLIPDDCKTHDLTLPAPERPPSYPAAGPLLPDVTHPPVPPPPPHYHKLMSFLHPQNSGNSPNHLTTHPLNLPPADSPTPPPQPHIHQTQHQFNPPSEISHQPHGPFKSMPLTPSHHSNPFRLHPHYLPPSPSHPTVPHPKQPPSPMLPTAQLAGPPLLPQSLPSLSCKPNEMMLTLPFVHPSFIQFRVVRCRSPHIPLTPIDQSDGWIPIGSADPACFMLKAGELGGLTLHLPLPACYSHTLSPFVITLYLRFWDMALGKWQILELKCPYSPGSSTHPPPSTPPTNHKLQLTCMADHMSVGIPPGVWDVTLQDVRGNEMRLQEARGDCGYLVREDESGYITLTLPFTPCLMTNQGQEYVIGIKVLREHGSEAQWLSCPVAPPISKQDCGLSSDGHLLCGTGSAPQSDCGTQICGPCPHSGPCYIPPYGYMADEAVSQPEESPSHQAEGANGVELRVATDQNYTSYYPESHRSYRLLLGRPLFLELRLVNAPDPTVALVVYSCLAYPSSEKGPWLVIYDSCAAHLDPQHRPPDPPSQVRRFTITTFQQLPHGDYYSPDEELNFMCSTAVCSQSEWPCAEGCFT